DVDGIATALGLLYRLIRQRLKIKGRGIGSHTLRVARSSLIRHNNGVTFGVRARLISKDAQGVGNRHMGGISREGSRCFKATFPGQANNDTDALSALLRAELGFVFTLDSSSNHRLRIR